MAGEGDHSLALMGAARAALLANPRVAAFVGNRVYESVPSRIAWPYLTISDGGGVAAFSSEYEGDDLAFEIHVWSRHTNGTSSECRLICAAVQAALHDADLDLGSGAALSSLARRSRRTFRDPDNLTWHGVVVFEARVETSED